MAKNANEITREQWLLECFPEWGTWLLEDIEEEQVKPGTFVSWWLGCTGIWIKTEGDTNLCFDLFSANAKNSHYNIQPHMKGSDFQLARIAGSKEYHANPRNIPHYIDPFKISKLDALLATHDHHDHMDIYSTAAVLKLPDVPFIGPKFSHDKWLAWGVPEDRIIQVKPGDVVSIGDCEIYVLESFDRTALVTAPPLGDIRGRFVDDMDERAVNYLVKTPGGTFYHAGDSHFSDYYLRHGKKFDVDVAVAPFGENPIGITDKMTSSDVLRMAQNLRCKVMIPIHWDIWPTFHCDPYEIKLLYNFKKEMMNYQFKLYLWSPGGKFVYPDDAAKGRHKFPMGFDDAMEEEPNIPAKWFL